MPNCLHAKRGWTCGRVREPSRHMCLNSAGTTSFREPRNDVRIAAEMKRRGNQPASLDCARPDGQTTCVMERGGGGNCTCRPVYATHCPQCGYALSSGDAQEMCREDEALRELIASWHRLTPTVREIIIEVARGAT